MIHLLILAINQLVLRLHDKYPGDVGVFAPYLLNYLVLEPGNALFMGANQPHAYLLGNQTNEY
jgi:mannose-6-phosphate isomerase